MKKNFLNLQAPYFLLLKIQNDYKNFTKEEIVQKIKVLNEKTKILDYLLELLISNKNIDDRTKEKDYYFIILVDLKNNKSRLFGFQKEDFWNAQKLYDFYEKGCGFYCTRQTPTAQKSLSPIIF